MYTNSALAPPPRAPRASAYGVALASTPRAVTVRRSISIAAPASVRDARCRASRVG
jgi:hypothetical protein